MTPGLKKTSRQNRYLLLRFYLLLALGLITTAALLDYGYSRYVHPAPDSDEVWLKTTLELIARTVPRDASLAGLADHARELGVEIHREIRLFDSDRFASALPPGELHYGRAESGDEVVWYRSPSAAGNTVVQLGLPSQNSAMVVADLIPLIFYCAIFVIVGFWLTPLIRDLNRLSTSARRFTADYRAPLDELDGVTHLTELADNMRLMSARIRQLIVTQQDLTNGLGHEIRTPLARMKFALAVAEGGPLENALAADLAPDINEIDDLISAMLDYARLDQSSLELELRVCATAELFEPFTAPSAHNVVVTFERSVESLEQVSCDPYLMTLAISNLVVNASRHAQARVQLCCVAGVAGEAVVRVDDDGAGVAESDRERIFAAFSRPEFNTAGARRGFGLGLAIVARVAEMHGGWVRVVDAPLGGARFELGWPGVSRRI